MNYKAELHSGRPELPPVDKSIRLTPLLWQGGYNQYHDININTDKMANVWKIAFLSIKLMINAI